MKVAINTSQGLGREAATKDSYLGALDQMGCEAVQIFPKDSEEVIAQKTFGCAGVILVGGPDIPPEFYGGRCHRTVKPQESQKVDHDFKLLHHSVKERLPVLGICAGMQTIACYFGGTLLPHIPEAGLFLKHNDHDGRHRLRLVTDRLANALVTTNPLVNTRHHQCVYDPGELDIDAFSPDGIIEAVSHPELPILGVQWHPEDLITESTAALNLLWSLMRGYR